MVINILFELKGRGRDQDITAIVAIFRNKKTMSMRVSINNYKKNVRKTIRRGVCDLVGRIVMNGSKLLNLGYVGQMNRGNL